MRVDLSCPKVAALANEVHELNAFLSTQDIQPESKFRGLQRIFSEGDLCTPYQWNKGGRLYPTGGGYQNISHKPNPKKPTDLFRQMIMINGEKIAEVDLKGSHLRILHTLKGMALPEDADPYHVSNVPREVVKYWVTTTLGYSKFHSRWTNDAKKKYAKDHEPAVRSLQKDFPFRKYHHIILDNMPIMQDWPSSPWRWGDLQYIESCILIDAMKALCLGQGIPALPLHDSLIVPVPYIDAAKRALSEAFYKHTGAWPGISVK